MTDTKRPTAQFGPFTLSKNLIEQLTAILKPAAEACDQVEVLYGRT